MRCAAGSTSAGRRSRRRSSRPGGEVVRPVAPPDADRGRPRGRRRRDGAGAGRSGRRRRGADATRSPAIGVGSPGHSDEETGEVSEARNLPDWEGTLPARRDALRCARRSGAGGQRRRRRDQRRVQAGRRQALRLDPRRVLGHRRRRRADPQRRAVDRARGAGEIGHMVVERGGARCPCGRRGCMEAYAGRGAMEAKARREHDNGVEDRSCSRS